MNANEQTQFEMLRKDVGRDIHLAIANFKIWLLAAVLTNVVLIGLPALFVFFNTQNTAQLSLNMAQDNAKSIKEQAAMQNRVNVRLGAIERHLSSDGTYTPPVEANTP